VVLFAIIKAAVKQGVTEAHQELIESVRVKTPLPAYPAAS
jgi:hypothetical protein